MTWVDSASDLGWTECLVFLPLLRSTTYLAWVPLKISPHMPDVSPGRVAYAGILLSLSALSSVPSNILGVKPYIIGLQNHSSGIVRKP